MTALKHRRRILAASLLGVLGIAGILAWQLTPPRDPILGSWSYDHGANTATFRFHADQRFDFTYPGVPLMTGTWRHIPGPYREETPGLPSSIIPAESPPSDLPTAPAHLRLYQHQFQDRDVQFAVLEDGELILVALDISYQRSGTWLTRAWERLRELFPKRHP